jgi:hypothetical protein
MKKVHLRSILLSIAGPMVQISLCHWNADGNAPRKNVGIVKQIVLFSYTVHTNNCTRTVLALALALALVLALALALALELALELAHELAHHKD